MRRLLITCFAVFAGLAGGPSWAETSSPTATESEPYVKLPAGKALREDGSELMLKDSEPPVSPMLLVSHQIVSESETAPDVLLGAATQAVVTQFRQDRHLQTTHPEKFAKLIETKVLPLFDFRHMTRLAVARNWHLASPAQQDALTAGFRTLLVHTYSTALTNYHEQVIEYKPPRMAPGETDVTVKSTVKPPGAERTAIDYDLEKTPAGWKIYDVSISGISLVSTYRSSFAETIRDSGVDGLIESLATQIRQIDAAPRSDEAGAEIFVLMYSAIQNFFRSIR